jgi:hypothetical protein
MLTRDGLRGRCALSLQGTEGGGYESARQQKTI